MRFLRQVVPLGELQKDGKTVLITRMFGDDIENLATTATAGVDLSAILSMIAEIQGDMASLQSALVVLTERVEKLEDGYQS